MYLILVLCNYNCESITNATLRIEYLASLSTIRNSHSHWIRIILILLVAYIILESVLSVFVFLWWFNSGLARLTTTTTELMFERT